MVSLSNHYTRRKGEKMLSEVKANLETLEEKLNKLRSYL